MKIVELGVPKQLIPPSPLQADRCTRRVKVGGGWALKTVRDFENERRQSLSIVRASIQQAFEQAGIEFFDDDGLRLKKK